MIPVAWTILVERLQRRWLRGGSAADPRAGLEVTERTMEATQDLLRRVRDLVNENATRSRLMKNHDEWLQLGSSLDTIGDCEMAISAYQSERDKSTNSPVEKLGSRYLRTYGVLQALFVQQDALLNLLEPLNATVDLDAYPELKTIRDIRIRSVGHPTKRNRGKNEPPSYHGIVQISFADESFQLWSDSEAGSWQTESINILELIGQQRVGAAQILGHAIATLEAGLKGPP